MKYFIFTQIRQCLIGNQLRNFEGNSLRPLCNATSHHLYPSELVSQVTDQYYVARKLFFIGFQRNSTEKRTNVDSLALEPIGLLEVPARVCPKYLRLGTYITASTRCVCLGRWRESHILCTGDVRGPTSSLWPPEAGLSTVANSVICDGLNSSKPQLFKDCIPVFEKGYSISILFVIVCL